VSCEFARLSAQRVDAATGPGPWERRRLRFPLCGRFSEKSTLTASSSVNSLTSMTPSDRRAGFEQLARAPARIAWVTV
jgi:hypothetical protein